MPPQDQADSVLSTILKTFRSGILKRTPFLREKTDNHKEWVTGCCNCSQACRFFLAIILVMHVGWVYIGNGMNQIHTQQTIVTNQGFKQPNPLKLTVQPYRQTPNGEPPTEPDPNTRQ